MNESDGGEPQFVMPPREAARRLGVAPSTLRRLAPTYEAVHGGLPWEGNESGGGRLWPSEAVERVEAARALVAEGRAKSLESALRALAGGAPPPSGVLSRPHEALELVEALRSELEAMRRGLAELPALRSEVAALRSELAKVRALPASEQSPAVEGRGAGDDGLMVQAARWLERRLRGIR
jgi:DNA-binding transcriptional MerR regulator